MATTNNILNNAASTSVASTTKTFTISNSNNTGTSAARMVISTGGATTTGDAQDSFIVTGVTTWSTGVDNSNSDNFVIARNAALGTNNSHVITVNGVNSFPLQPCFLAIQTADQINATGNGFSSYTLGTTAGLTQIFDKGSNFTGVTFTAPVTGQYLFIASATISNCLLSTGMQIQISPSGAGRTLVKTQFRPPGATDVSINLSGIITMVAGTTAICRVVGLGESSNRCTVLGGTTTVRTFFAGYLMC